MTIIGKGLLIKGVAGAGAYGAHRRVPAARARGMAIPAELSVVALGHPTRLAPELASLTFTGFRIPRREMGWRAVELLAAVIDDTANEQTRQQLLPCEPVDGATLAPPR